MVFDLRSFLQRELPPVNTEQTFDFQNRDFGDVQVPGPAVCNFTARLAAGEAALTLSVQAEIAGVCARCLAPVEQSVRAETALTVRQRDLDDPDFELPLTANGCLDVAEWAYQELFLAIPRVLLCSPDCPGLCPVCGQRKTACTCAPTADAAPKDARLSVLQRFLRDE